MARSSRGRVLRRFDPARRCPIPCVAYNALGLTSSRGKTEGLLHHGRFADIGRLDEKTQRNSVGINDQLQFYSFAFAGSVRARHTHYWRHIGDVQEALLEIDAPTSMSWPMMDAKIGGRQPSGSRLRGNPEPCSWTRRSSTRAFTGFRCAKLRRWPRKPRGFLPSNTELTLSRTSQKGLQYLLLLVAYEHPIDKPPSSPRPSFRIDSRQIYHRHLHTV